MMIKAGIVVSAAAATLLAVSPLAFAGDYDSGHHKSHHSKSHHHDNDHHGDRNRGGNRSCDQDTSARNDNGRGRGGGGGLLNISNNAVQVPIQACNNNILNNIGLGILGSGRANQR